MAAPRAGDLAAARWVPREGVDPAALAALLERAAAALATEGAVRKASRRKTLHAIALGDGVDHLLKANDYRGAPLLRRLRRSRSARELARASAAAARGVPTPVPVAAGELRRRGLLERCFLLVPLVPGAVDLERLRAERAHAPRERRACERALGALARRMHDAGVFQEDFAPNNFLWRADPPPRLWAIDFERVRLGAPLSRAARTLLLARLERRLADASGAARMRFLLAYADEDRAAARRWWLEVEARAPRLARRDRRRWERTATHPSRRFAPMERAGWRGWARRDADPAALAGVLDGERVGEAAFLVRWLGRLSRRRAARAWGLAQMLWQRGGASPKPLALLRSSRGAALVFERPSGCQRLDTLADRRRLEPQLAIALDRLLRLGARPEALTADRLGAAAQGSRIWLLDPLVVSPGRHPPVEVHRRARECAARLAGTG